MGRRRAAGSNVTDIVVAEATNAAPAGGYLGYGAKPYRAYLMGVLMVIYGLNLADRGLVGLLQEKIKPEFDLSDFELGLLGGPAFALCNTLAGLPLARLSERFNRIGVLAICTALWSVMTACCGLAASFPMLLCWRDSASASARPAVCRRRKASSQTISPPTSALRRSHCT